TPRRSDCVTTRVVPRGLTPRPRTRLLVAAPSISNPAVSLSNHSRLVAQPLNRIRTKLNIAGPARGIRGPSFDRLRTRLVFAAPSIPNPVVSLSNHGWLARQALGKRRIAACRIGPASILLKSAARTY